MPIIEMPDGNKVDMGDNPSPEMEAAVARKYQELESAKLGQSTTTTTTTQPPDATTTSGTTTPAAPEKKSSGWIPTIARTAGPILGGISGIPLGPAGIIAGTAVGATAGDLIAQ